MLKIIEVIKDANEKDCPLPALALALTLPDICSQIEYPDEKNVGYRYRNWYDNHVEHDEETKEMFANRLSTDHDRHHNFHKFNGYVCYKLRCLLLHQGEAAIEGEIKYDNLHFHIHSGDTVINDQAYFINGRLVEHVSINSKMLCYYLCDNALSYYENHENKELFKKKIMN